MTDTTDIKALRHPVREQYDWSNAVWRDCDQCGTQHTGTVTAEDGSQICAHCADQLYWSAWQGLAERALDLLEAERQRADDRAKENYRNKCDVDNCMETIANLEAELAALKGDRVPVALIDERQGSGGFCLTQYGRRLNLQHGTELFTAPQKPIVLPEKSADAPLSPEDYPNIANFALGYNHGIDDCRAAIEAAGGIVKDGE